MSVKRPSLGIPQTTCERRAFLVRGIVQGVGFRPFVHRIATDLGLVGFVRNQSGMVHVEIEGLPESVVEFSIMLTSGAPPLARIESVESRSLPLLGDVDFQIKESIDSEVPSAISISPDVATCADCVRELFDPSDRRYLYPFVNCTNCGPRLTIIRGAPYDRLRTTMAIFTMCADCRREYVNPADRRFHAQPIACPACGPRLRLLTNTGQPIETTDPVCDFVAAIRNGKIGALKGLGGYHLVCDARNNSAVSELRRRKHRDQKPFALMVDSVDEARRYCEVDSAEAALLRSPRRPIVLLRTRQDDRAETVAPSIAPSSLNLGMMLPYTPLHHLLLSAVESSILVMTSGNRADEPIAYDDDDAIARLENIVDLVLAHDRSIHVRCDDSVVRSIDGVETLLRRSRGYAPEPLSLPIALALPTLAVGGQLKSTFALGHEKRAVLSHHLGDLNHFSAFEAFERDIGLFEAVFETRPACVVHDLHPDYASTTYARRRAAEQSLRLLAVQHHHAHIASCMAEHSLSGPVIGVAFDGTGYGTDGHIWGGEFLVADYQGFERFAHLRYVGLPGGDAAIREPWRSAMAHLIDADCQSPALIEHVGHDAARTIYQMVSRRFNTPLTSSMGRLFDAVAALLGIRTTVTFEGQAAVELELLASQASPDHAYPFELDMELDLNRRTCFSIDTRPLIRAILQDISDFAERELIARRFHSTITDVTKRICHKLRTEFALEQVVLSGGVFMNSLLSIEVAQQLSKDGFKVYRQHLVPCNDGGISLGQLAVAAASYPGP
ncbi:carbamoyltransferase HypF [Schlesneria paludicola]|uniref:carbamoyltransferase HypF n=1 Tax=Schlesneria paludicola TaxID=360056 RepID=UPI00029AA39A|nr:carbamoyltransferase HypF [Schlesneria paludicola]